MRVVNKYKEKYTHYIGRGSILGNPYEIGLDGTREEVIKKYEQRTYSIIFHSLDIQPLRQAIYDLPENAILGCYCKPKACHGNVIIKIWKELHNV